MTAIHKNQQGFTIIEVLIVLVIAAVIMLIVFLAVPALQRNSRNNGRSNDASRIASAISECLANNSNSTAACQSGVDPGNLAQIGNFVWVGGYIEFWQGNTETALYAFGYVCDGNEAVSGGSSSSFAIEYQNETSGAPANRCVES